MDESKAEYVRRQKQTRYHTCHWLGCDKQVPPAMWGCRAHWFRLPRVLRDKIWGAFQPGQERGDVQVSQSYFDVAQEVDEWVKTQVQREAA